MDRSRMVRNLPLTLQSEFPIRISIWHRIRFFRTRHNKSAGRLTRDGKDEKKYERMRLGVGCLAARKARRKYWNNSELLIPRRGDADGNQASLAYRRRRSCRHPSSNRAHSTSRRGSDDIGVER